MWTFEQGTSGSAIDATSQSDRPDCLELKGSTWSRDKFEEFPFPRCYELFTWSCLGSYHFYWEGGLSVCGGGGDQNF